MTSSPPTLADLRQKIDEIDSDIHDLLMARTDIVRQIAAAKRGDRDAGAGERAGEEDATGWAMRPGREAAILRRLVARHRGDLPPVVIVRLWRELIAAKTRLQGPLSVSVFSGAAPLAYWDLARFHYGSTTPMEQAGEVAEVLAAVGRDQGRIGLVPLPGDGSVRAPASPAWWRSMAASSPRLWVIARLPFAVDETVHRAQALVVAAHPPEPSGQDTTLLAVTVETGTAPQHLEAAMEAAGFASCAVLAEDGPLRLCQVEGFHGAESVAVNAAAAPVRRIEVVGAYATPFRLDGAMESGMAPPGGET